MGAVKGGLWTGKWGEKVNTIFKEGQDIISLIVETGGG